MLPLAEACWLHGVQLAKEPYRATRRFALEVVSLSRQFRHASFRQGAREALVAHVLANCKVRHCKRPDHLANEAQELFDALFPDKEVFFCHPSAGTAGRKQLVAFRRRAEALFECFDIVRRPDGSRRLVYCYFSWREPAANLLPGPGDGRSRRGCDSVLEGWQKVAAAVCNFAFAAA